SARTALQGGFDNRALPSAWAAARNISAKRDFAAIRWLGSSDAAVIHSRMIFPARTTRSSATPQRCAFPSRSAPVSAIRIELAAAAIPVPERITAEMATVERTCITSSQHWRLRARSNLKSEFVGFIYDIFAAC